jgi:hypothetical protein
VTEVAASQKVLLKVKNAQSHFAQSSKSSLLKKLKMLKVVLLKVESLLKVIAQSIMS